jgi:hypothetical protein
MRKLDLSTLLPEFKITEQPIVDKDSSVKLQATPPKGGEDYEHEESSRPVISYADSLNQHSDDTYTSENNENPKKRSKQWHNTIGDVQRGEMIEGRSSRGKSKHKQNMVNFALMANVQENYEPQLFEEAKGRPKWEKAMVVEHESLMKN